MNATSSEADLPADIGEWCRHIPAEDEGDYPIDQSDGGEDDDPREHAQWAAQLQAQGAYIDSDLDELGGSTIQLAVGGVYRWPAYGIAVRFALVEDLISDATPDFGLYLGVHFAGGR